MMKKYIYVSPDIFDGHSLTLFSRVDDQSSTFAKHVFSLIVSFDVLSASA